MAWRTANSLNVLRDQVNAAAPRRSKVSDGTIGDANHSPTSDHAPKDFPGWGNDIVTARDITHDPRAGADMDKISEQLRLSRDARIKYVIWRDRMYSSYPSAGRPGWTWRPYSGTFHSHLHVSVVGDQRADQTHPWRISAGTASTTEGASMATIDNLFGVLWTGGTDMGAAVPQKTNTAGAGNSLTDLAQYTRRQVDNLVAAVAASAQREQDLAAALTALAAGGTSIDTAAVIAAIDARTADVTGQLDALQAENADLRAALARTEEAAKADLSPAEQAGLDGTP